MALTLTVTGMACGACEQNVEEALTAVPAVESASADRETETVTVEGDPDVSTLVQAIEDVGYDANA